MVIPRNHYYSVLLILLILGDIYSFCPSSWVKIGVVVVIVVMVGGSSLIMQYHTQYQRQSKTINQLLYLTHKMMSFPSTNHSRAGLTSVQWICFSLTCTGLTPSQLVIVQYRDGHDHMEPFKMPIPIWLLHNSVGDIKIVGTIWRRVALSIPSGDWTRMSHDRWYSVTKSHTYFEHLTF